MKTLLTKINSPRWFFALGIILGCLPVLLYPFFARLDGPAHLYNAKILALLLGGDALELLEFYQLNALFIPNILGHYLLAVLQWIIPMQYAEKVLILSYSIGTPLFLYKLLARQTVFRWGALFFLVVTTPFFLTMGFYNFLMSVTLLLATLYYWELWSPENLTKTRLFALVVLLLGTYLAHIFTFFLLVGMLVLHVFSHILVNHRYPWRTRAWALLKVVILPVVLAVRFVTRPVGPDIIQDYEWLPITTLFQQLLHMEAFVSYDHTQEIKLLRWLPLILVVFTAYTKFHLFKSIKKKEPLQHHTIFWGLAVIFAFLGLFILPDSDGSAGYFSIRISFFFFLFWMLWLAMHMAKIPNGFRLSGLLIWVLLLFPLFWSNINKSKDVSAQAAAIQQIGKDLLPYETLLPLGAPDNWLTHHFVNYLGIHNPVIILNNYEAANDYFPVKWNNPMLPRLYVHKTPLREWEHMKGFINGYRRPLPVDLILVYQNFHLDATMQTLLVEHFELTHSTETFRLYHYKN
jgi:hypothetical protein